MSTINHNEYFKVHKVIMDAGLSVDSRSSQDKNQTELFFFNCIVLRQAVSVVDLWILNSMQQHVHTANSQHGLIKVVAIEHGVVKVVT